MLIVKDHAGRYTLRQPSGELIGQLLRSNEGWMYRDDKGNGPRRPEVSAIRALNMAEIIGHLKPTVYRGGWNALILDADKAFNHNSRIAQNA